MTIRPTLALAAWLLASGPVPPPARGFEIEGGDGTVRRAATAGDALALARTLHRHGVVTITFPPGLLRLTTPIVLDARDSDTVLRAAPEGTTLSGAAVIASAGAARIDDPRAGTLPPYRYGEATPEPLPQLYVGAARLRPASWPDEGYRHGWRVEQTAGGPLLRALSASLPPTAGPVLVSGFFGPGWAWDAIPARAVDGGLLLARTPEFGITAAARLRVSGALPPGPGRYAPDARGARLGAPAAAPVELAVAPSLLTLTGVSHVRIDGLAFERSAGAAVRIDDSADVRLSGCAVRQTGGGGVAVTGGRGVVVDRCRVTDTGGTAVFVSAGRRAELEPSGDAITGSTIARWGRDLPLSPGVTAWGVGALLRGNRIAGGEGAAVALQGNDHRVEGNEIAWAVCAAEDAGAVYFGRDWTQRGIVIAGNYLHDIAPGRDIQAAGVYLDDLASGALVARNAFARTPFGVILGGGRDNRIEGNLFAFGGKAAISFDARGTTWAKALAQPGGALLARLGAMPYRSALWRGRYPALAALPDERAAEPAGNVVTNNARIDAQPMWSLTPGYTLVAEADRPLAPTRADRDVLDAPDRERAWPVLARLGKLDPAPPWRTTPPTGVTGCD